MTHPAAPTTSRNKLTGSSRKEAMRCLKRRISDAVYRQLRADLTAETRTGPGGQSGATLKSSAAGRSLNAGTSEKSFPNPTHKARTDNPSCHGVTQRAQTPPTTSPLTQTGFALRLSHESNYGHRHPNIWDVDPQTFRHLVVPRRRIRFMRQPPLALLCEPWDRSVESSAATRERVHRPRDDARRRGTAADIISPPQIVGGLLVTNNVRRRRPSAYHQK